MLPNPTSLRVRSIFGHAENKEDFRASVVKQFKLSSHARLQLIKLALKKVKFELDTSVALEFQNENKTEDEAKHQLEFLKYLSEF